MLIYCCNCKKDVEARQITGLHVYPHRHDLHHKLFFECPVCKGFVGTHEESGKPLGVIASPEIKNARQYIHKLIDPLFLSKKITRKHLYNKIAKRMGIAHYHTAEIRTIEEARQVYKVCLQIAKELG